MPSVMGQDHEFHATDYNLNSINWCKENLKGIHFNHNSLKADLPYADDFFDVIYGISILTHLSEKLHYDWVKELKRILKPDGIMILTTQGDNYKVKLTENELRQYLSGNLIIRARVKEGHRTYSAFHPKSFMHQLFKGTTILAHIESTPDKSKRLPQDIWIV
jgi:cyclopropane fatty-acyl-phospholipid synthase-like methyltransferase